MFYNMVLQFCEIKAFDHTAMSEQIEILRIEDTMVLRSWVFTQNKHFKSNSQGFESLMLLRKLKLSKNWIQVHLDILKLQS